MPSTKCDCSVCSGDFYKPSAKKMEGLKTALNKIQVATDPDGDENYRADDREGCLDYVFDVAKQALAEGENEAKEV